MIGEKSANALTEVGEASAPLVLARLVLLLMQDVDDAQRVNTAIDAALDGFRPGAPADGH